MNSTQPCPPTKRHLHSTLAALRAQRSDNERVNHSQGIMRKVKGANKKSFGPLLPLLHLVRGTWGTGVLFYSDVQSDRFLNCSFPHRVHWNLDPDTYLRCTHESRSGPINLDPSP